MAKGELAISFTISLLSIVLLLIIQYNGIVKPIIILTTLPLALIGAFLGLYVMDYPLGFMPQLGLLSLFGIVVNTAIIFLEFADKLIEEKIRAKGGSGPIQGITKHEFRECLVQAGQVRLLPIAMTTLTTIGGLLPLALAGGPLWEGMSWLMIFGLIVATESARRPAAHTGRSQVSGNGSCSHHGRSVGSIDTTHLTHHGPRRPGATMRTGAP